MKLMNNFLDATLKQYDSILEFNTFLHNVEKELMFQEHKAIINEDYKVFKESVKEKIKAIADKVVQTIKKAIKWIQEQLTKVFNKIKSIKNRRKEKQSSETSQSKPKQLTERTVEGRNYAKIIGDLGTVYSSLNKASNMVDRLNVGNFDEVLQSVLKIYDDIDKHSTNYDTVKYRANQLNDLYSMSDRLSDLVGRQLKTVGTNLKKSEAQAHNIAKKAQSISGDGDEFYQQLSVFAKCISGLVSKTVSFGGIGVTALSDIERVIAGLE
jgi:hypothetical protein